MTTRHTMLTGIVKLEVLGAENFKPDTDYFLVTVFGSTSFRTKVIKKNFEGAWNAIILLVVRENEKGYLVKFSLYSLNKFSQNDLIAYCTLKMPDIFQHAAGFTVEIPMVQSRTLLSIFFLWLTLSSGFSQELKKQAGHTEPILKLRGKFATLSKMKKNLWLHVAEDMCREDHMVNKVDVWALFNSVDLLVSDEEITRLFQIAGKDENRQEIFD